MYQGKTFSKMYVVEKHISRVKVPIGGIQYLRKEVEVGKCLVNCLPP